MHSHCAILNRIRGTDGTWRTLDSRAIYRHAHAAGAVYGAVLERELSERLGVSWVTTPFGGRFGPGTVGFETNQGTLEMTTISGMGVGPDFIKVMGLELVAGRDVADDVASAAGAGGPAQQINEIVVNETLARAQHWDEAIGKRFELGQGPNVQKGTVVGVVKDFNFQSVQDRKSVV